MIGFFCDGVCSVIKSEFFKTSSKESIFILKSKFLFSIFIINAYFFSALSISEVFEDYIKNDKIKSVANKLLYASAVAIPLITIILITSL